MIPKDVIVYLAFPVTVACVETEHHDARSNKHSSVTYLTVTRKLRAHNGQGTEYSFPGHLIHVLAITRFKFLFSNTSLNRTIIWERDVSSMNLVKLVKGTSFELLLLPVLKSHNYQLWLF